MDNDMFEREENRRYFAITALGKDRWYWVVWPSLDELRASETPLLHISEGCETSKLAALDRAVKLSGPSAEWIAGKYARAHHRSTGFTSSKKCAAHTLGAASSPAQMEFLYREVYDTISGECYSLPYRVVNKTRKYVYVEQHPYDPQDFTGSWLDLARPTYRLERQSLDENGYALIPATVYVSENEEPIFFSYEQMRLHENKLFKCLDTLHLTLPYTASQAKGAYRRLVRSAHPDGGGSQELFMALQDAYQQALQLCHPLGSFAAFQ